MKGALRLGGSLMAAATWLLIATLAPASAQDYGPGQPDPCTFVTPFDPDPFAQTGPSLQSCTSDSLRSSDGTRTLSVDVYRFPDVAQAVAFAQSMAGDRPLVSGYGDMAWEGSDSGQFRIVFVVHNYVGVSGSFDEDSDQARANATQLSAAMVPAIGPPLAGPSPATPLPTATPSPTPSGTGGLLTIGVGCGADERFVRCTSSVSGARPDADLVYEWSFNGQTRPETGSTMQLDWLTESIAAGSHTVAVSVRDARNNLGPATNAITFAIGTSGPPKPEDALAAAAAAAAATAIALALAGAAGSSATKGTAESSRPSPEADALDSALELEDAERGNLPPYDNPAAWKGLVNWPPAFDHLYSEFFAVCRNANDDPTKMLACLRDAAATYWDALTAAPPGGTTPPPPATDPSAVAADLLGAEAGNLPPINTPADLEKWRALTGWPDGPEALQYLVNAIGNTSDMTPAQRLQFLRGEASRVRAAIGAPPATPAAPEPLDPTDVLDRDFEP